MEEILYDAFPWTPIAVCLITAFFVYGTSSGKRQTTQQRRPNPDGYWVGRATEAERRSRDLEYKLRREIEWYKKKYYDAYKNKKR